jgi:pimeloyl-ACP methyl ester carboxylesterase
MHWRMSEARHVEAGGQRIAYHRLGVGPTSMVFLHGITTHSFIWRNLIEILSERFDCIALDLLGCGASDKPAGVDYSINAQAVLMAEALAALGVARSHLVCHDIGGGVGQIMAVNHPERVRSLTLINTIAYDYWPVQPIITMRVPIIRQLAMSALDLGMFRMLIERGMYHKERLSKELMEMFREPLRTREGRNGFLHLAHCLDNRNLMDRASALRELDLPVLIIRGDADVYLTPAISRRLASELPRAELVRIETGGHFLMEDEPALLVELIESFAKAHEPR